MVLLREEHKVYTEYIDLTDYSELDKKLEAILEEHECKNESGVMLEVMLEDESKVLKKGNDEKVISKSRNNTPTHNILHDSFGQEKWKNQLKL